MRLVVSLCVLIVMVVFVLWSQDIEPIELGDYASRTVRKTDFWGPVAGDGKDKKTKSTSRILTDDDMTMTKRMRHRNRADDDDNLFEPPRNGGKYSLVSFGSAPTSKRKETKKQRRRRQRQPLQWINEQQQSNRNSNGLRLHKIAVEKFESIPTITNTDDSIPVPSMAAGGTLVQAADALLCRQTVLDYVINATDLKDECDGLKKAYTQTCAATDQDGSESSDTPPDAPQPSKTNRRLYGNRKTNRVLYWQYKLSRLSRRLRSWWSGPDFTENQILEVWEESKMELELELELELQLEGDESFANDRRNRWRMLEEWDGDDDTDDISQALFDEFFEYDDDDDNDDDDDDDAYSVVVESFNTNDSFGAIHRRTTDQRSEGAADGEAKDKDKDKDDNEDDDEDDDDGAEQYTKDGDDAKDNNDPSATGVANEQTSVQGQEPENAAKTTKETGTKKPLANLALPVKSKHVSEKTLTETLMLQQDDKLMKTVASEQEHTATEAKADAAVSSKAVSDAADMISNVLNDPTSVEARTCCTSILNVFHENCNVDQEEELSDRRLLVGVAVIACCGLIKSLIRHFQIRWLPEAAGCIMVGVTAGYISTFYPHHDVSFDGNWFLRIMVPPIVFEAALSIDKRSFTRHIVPILFYAVLGTLMATVLTAIVVSEGSRAFSCENIPYTESLAFGALISSIDPIAVLSVLSNMGMTDQDTIYVVIFGESLLNDGVAIVLFDTIVHFLDDNMIVDDHAVTAAVAHFLVVFLGSLLIGIFYGLCCTLYYWMMFGCQTPLVEVLMFCCWALVPYYVCDGIQWSGIVAVVAAGFIMDMHVVGSEKLSDMVHDESDSNYENDPEKVKERRRRAKVRRPIFSKEGLLSKEAKTHIAFVTEIIATMMETAIFAYLGLFLFSSRYHWNIYHVLIAICGCCLSRATMIPSLSFLANWITRIQQSGAICRSHELPQQSNHPDTPSHRPNQAAGVIIDSKMQLVLWFAGLRGAMSFALVEHIPLYDAVSGEGSRLKSELKAMTSACIIFTVFIQGGSTYYMMDALGLSPKAKGDGAIDREAEMVGLLTAVSSIDSDGGRDNSEIKDRLPQENENNEEIISQNSSASSNSLRRPGKPVRRQRKAGVC